MTDDDFLRQILATPDDESLRLVYADWLEERGDKRSGYLRLLNVIREIEPGSIRYQQIHRQLHELEQSLNAAWIDLVRRAHTLPSLDLVTCWSLAELQGFLRAFTWVNGKTNHDYTFEANLLRKSGIIEDVLKVHLADAASGMRVTALTALEDWQAEFESVIARWFCAYLLDSDSTGRLHDEHRTFTLSHETSRPYLVRETMRRLLQVVTPTAVWRVNIESVGFYECAWDDFALEAPDRVLFIHFGVSD